MEIRRCRFMVERMENRLTSREETAATKKSRARTFLLGLGMGKVRKRDEHPVRRAVFLPPSDETSMKPAALSFGLGKALLLVGALTGLLFGSAACGGNDGTTPDCEDDVGDGTHAINPKGCNQFAVCIVGGKVVNAEQCCKSLTNDYEHAACLYGYGAGPAPKQ